MSCCVCTGTDDSRDSSILIDVLLSAGKEIKLWKYDDNDSTWNAVCSKLPASDIILAKFEPKSNVFATLGKVCRQRMIHAAANLTRCILV